VVPSLANVIYVIYKALSTLDDRFATCKLISKKPTLVAPRLSPDLAAVGRSKEDWQVDGLSPTELALLDEVDPSAGPSVLDGPSLRADGRSWRTGCFVTGDEVHGDAGHHFKALLSWNVWEHERGVIPPLPHPRAALARFEQIVRGLGTTPITPSVAAPDDVKMKGRPRRKPNGSGLAALRLVPQHASSDGVSRNRTWIRPANRRPPREAGR